eukprot:g9096.t1
MFTLLLDSGREGRLAMAVLRLDTPHYTASTADPASMLPYPLTMVIISPDAKAVRSPTALQLYHYASNSCSTVPHREGQGIWSLLERLFAQKSAVEKSGKDVRIKIRFHSP